MIVFPELALIAPLATNRVNSIKEFDINIFLNNEAFYSIYDCWV